MKRRKPLARRAGLKRTSGLRPKALRQVKTDKGYDLARAALWHQHVTMGGRVGQRRPCAVCGSLARIEAHHIIAKQTLRWVARERGYGWDREQELIWDRRNGMPLCAKCHQRHETAFIRVPRRVLPADALRFAEDENLMYLIERYYPS